MSNSSIDQAGLRNLYESDSSAQMVFDSLAARQNQWGMTTVSSIEFYFRGAGAGLSRKDIIKTFQALERFNCGEFKLGSRKGNRNKQTRIIWKVNLVTVGKIARGQANN
jgi:hypothetical protein